MFVAGGFGSYENHKSELGKLPAAACFGGFFCKNAQFACRHPRRERCLLKAGNNSKKWLISKAGDCKK